MTEQERQQRLEELRRKRDENLERYARTTRESFRLISELQRVQRRLLEDRR